MPKATVIPLSDRDWLTLSEAASRLGVSADTVRRWIAGGKVKSWQPIPNGTHRISASSIDALMAEWTGNDPAA